MKSWRNWIVWPVRKNRSQRPEEATRNPPPNSVVSLRFRLFLTVAVALIPIIALNIFQGMERARVDIENVHARLVQSARMAASHEENAFASGEQILRALANLDTVQRETRECDNALSDALLGVRFLTNLARIDADGKVACSALPEVKGQDLSKSALFMAARTSSDFVVGDMAINPATRLREIGAMLPLRDSAGHFEGAMAMGVSVRWMDYILSVRELAKGAVVSIFDSRGSIIATNNVSIAKAIYARLPASETLNGALEARVDNSGAVWAFAAAPLIKRKVFVALAMRESRLFGATYLRLVTDFLLPIVMIGLAWAGIWIATDRQATRWIVYLRRVAAAYRGGHYRMRPSLDNAPAEFKQLGAAMAQMAASIEDRDLSLREAVAQKTRQVRETHHRVKNNLQVVMSLLSLQAAQSNEQSVREALRGAQARIRALALVHRILNDVEDQTSVNMKLLLSELTYQVVEGFTIDRSGISVNLDVAPLELPGEMAVPLALFVTESLSNIFRHAYPPSQPHGTVRVALTPQDENLYNLSVVDDGVGFSGSATGTGMGEKLLNLFGRQARGTVSVSSQPGRGTRVELVFSRFPEDAPEEKPSTGGAVDFV